ncbi:MAG: aminomethyl-transferring glycine dehydrogenase subunit GcvPB [Desulfobacterales bacterium]|nr:aminomethyl-transferring glycine dehydrogenase subunit GcvPB [Desulfobacterales bacterium]
MKEVIHNSGLVLDEKLLWEKGKKGRIGFSIPPQDVAVAELDPELVGEDPDFPDLSEVDVVRHFTRLSTWNFGVDTGMYPLGSCTMKYNPKTNERQASLAGLSEAHPFLPESLSQGALQIMYELEQYLMEITGMDAVTLQPAAGAHGEMLGMLLIHAWHSKKGNSRSKIIVPDTAHGTNPASAALCGYKPIPVKSDENGIIPVETIRELMDDETAGIMITNPNTLGLFEENIQEISEIVHAEDGLVYGDGANMNAVMGIVKMGNIGVDIMHLNLHKTFSTPHGGGGPGAGPVAVKKDLIPFLPAPRVVFKNGQYSLEKNLPDSVGRMTAFYGHFNVLIKAYSYIRQMGPDNLKKASRLAVLNANYIKEQLKDTLHLAYDRPCMHECIFSDKNQAAHKISTMDMAKRLLDYGIHPPTVYFPLVVHGAIMVEPTETESKEDIDLFIETFKTIAKEAEENPDILTSAPHVSKRRRLDEVEAARHPCLTG